MAFSQKVRSAAITRGVAIDVQDHRRSTHARPMLSVSASSDENARRAIDQLRSLAGCDVHTTTILGTVDEDIFRNLGISVTSEPRFLRKQLYHKR